jgi:hypothetical protein
VQCKCLNSSKRSSVANMALITEHFCQAYCDIHILAGPYFLHTLFDLLLSLSYSCVSRCLPYLSFRFIFGLHMMYDHRIHSGDIFVYLLAHAVSYAIFYVYFFSTDGPISSRSPVSHLLRFFRVCSIYIKCRVRSAV